MSVALHLAAMDERAKKQAKPKPLAPLQSLGCSASTMHSERLVERNGVNVRAYGDEIEGTSLSMAFEVGSEEYEEMIKKHADRVADAIAKAPLLQSEILRQISTVRSDAPVKLFSAVKPLPYGLRSENLLLVSCALCRSQCLGESMEHFRLEAFQQELQSFANFPQPVCARLFGHRPYCHKCVKELRAAGEIERGKCKCPVMIPAPSSTLIKSPIRRRRNRTSKETSS